MTINNETKTYIIYFAVFNLTEGEQRAAVKMNYKKTFCPPNYQDKIVKEIKWLSKPIIMTLSDSEKDYFAIIKTHHLNFVKNTGIASWRIKFHVLHESFISLRK